MDKLSKITLIILLIAILAASVFAYNRFFIEKDYIIELETSCDELSHSCFIFTCTEENGSECETYYYKIITIEARDLYNQCGANAQNCEIQCVASSGCTEIYCDNDKSIDDKICSGASLP